LINFTFSQAKTQFKQMMATAQREPICITQNGQPSVVVMPVEDYNAFAEFKLQNLRAKFEHSINQAKLGKLHEGEWVFDELIKDL
jgi:prevent-host-death family protein